MHVIAARLWIQGSLNQGVKHYQEQVIDNAL